MFISNNHSCFFSTISQEATFLCLWMFSRDSQASIYYFAHGISSRFLKWVNNVHLCLDIHRHFHCELIYHWNFLYKKINVRLSTDLHRLIKVSPEFREQTTGHLSIQFSSELQATDGWSSCTDSESFAKEDFSQDSINIIGHRCTKPIEEWLLTANNKTVNLLCMERFPQRVSMMLPGRRRIQYVRCTL